ncbi:hypothetical protein [Gracilibacillus timonensis]|uniref:hypothetical protein n=1 Tax=Gracilibacillus timonensis TaxID=1816696 RepID=UPI000826EA63|nr:hypothetical protein [Gracilibacillus timonensis]
MKKIIFEQTGNILLVLLLMLAMIQTVHSVTITEAPFSSSFNLGFFWFILFIWVLIFGLARFLYGRNTKNGGYSTKKGELSAIDEREEIISKRASLVTYRILIITMIVILFLCFGLSLFFSDIKTVQTVMIVGVGSGLIVSFLAYLITWITLDTKG